ncbi:MAG: replication-associated recombination protein A [Pseudobdellovibrio sp.]
MSQDLFQSSVDPEMLPLAERIRPQNFEEILGQSHFLSNKSALYRILKSQQLLNLIFWGPPGTGKTSLAMSLARVTQAHFMQLNAVDAGVKDLKAACEEGRTQKLQYNRKTVLFVDEIHRFNKSQQDVLLPYVEKGDVYLIGATTEHPSYELNKALLSRCQVVEFKKLTSDSLRKIINKASEKLNINLLDLFLPETLDSLIDSADGDARRLLNIFDTVTKFYSVKTDEDPFPLSLDNLEMLMGRKMMSYDKKSDQHYDCISAFIKSLRGSDPDAALYYCARMLEGGEDPVFIARRMIIFASEDIGNADPRALTMAVSCLQAIEAIGMPEGRITLGQTITYLASCPKSNRAYVAINSAIDYVKKTGTAEIPLYLRSSYKGEGYKYPHSYPKGYVAQRYWPLALKEEKFYEPSQKGFEKNISEYLKWLRETKD